MPSSRPSLSSSRPLAEADRHQPDRPAGTACGFGEGDGGERGQAPDSAALTSWPIAAQTGKLNLRAAHSMPLENCIQYERDLQTVTFGTEDAAEGRAAFKQKRDPQFNGR
ncbi:hypothetical protein ACQP25_27985 [Microtetraspora malaysiensis]|uniref:hypothetical protein n=1 Tax=Microtetraspora malaysiensis TaxID=161358 RepID=UPI003D8F79B8